MTTILMSFFSDLQITMYKCKSSLVCSTDSELDITVLNRTC